MSERYMKKTSSQKCTYLMELDLQARCQKKRRNIKVNAKCSSPQMSCFDKYLLGCHLLQNHDFMSEKTPWSIKYNLFIIVVFTFPSDFCFWYLPLENYSYQNTTIIVEHSLSVRGIAGELCSLQVFVYLLALRMSSFTKNQNLWRFLASECSR